MTASAFYSTMMFFRLLLEKCPTVFQRSKISKVKLVIVGYELIRIEGLFVGRAYSRVANTIN